MRRLVLLVIFLMSQPVISGEISNTYQQGAFGVKWGDTIDNIKTVFPAVKRETYKQVVMYVARDGRPLFNIERKKNSLITFGFNPEQKLNSIAIDLEIEDYSKLLAALDAEFGDHIMKSDDQTARIAVWPKDNDIEISLIMARAGFFTQEVKTSFNILYTGK
ncbi:MAG: hypothetical protein OEZ15_02910 [Gammaproteobacteria bacterium]|nr:hypothetical protein [Gammaproteobacteria bacterium]